MCPAAEVREQSAETQLQALSVLGRDLAQRAWTEHGGAAARVPRHPALSAWTALADTLRRRRVERLERGAQAAFVAAYRQRLVELARGASGPAPVGSSEP